VPPGQGPGVLSIEVQAARALRFDDGAPVRSASGIAPLGDGFLIAQDDAAHAAWMRGDSIDRVRIVPAVDGSDVFSAASGTKHLKPDLEAACPVEVEGLPGVLLLGSGSTPARMRAALVTLGDGLQVQVSDLSPLYARVADVLGIAPTDLNLEGAARKDEVLRWFARGNPSAGIPSASVDLDLQAMTTAVLRGDGGAAVAVRRPLRYDLSGVDGVGLAVTDAVALPDGRLLLSAAAEDTPNAYDDGPVVAAALALVDGEDLVALAPLPQVGGAVAKLEGLALLVAGPYGALLLGVVDDDDPEVPSTELTLAVRWS
jgi:hypothetical protein